MTSALICTIAPAIAQDDVITVTATKRDQAPREIPGSVSVLDGQSLELADIYNSAEDLTQRLSGVQAAVANGTQIAFQIRGIGAVDHQALTPTAAAVYQDGVFLATNVETGAFLFDIDRVEVLKGPQGSLYGRNASSGAISLVSHTPGSDAPNYLTGSYGSFDRFDGQLGLSFETPNGLNARIAGRVLSQRPALDNVSTNDGLPLGPQRAGGTKSEWGIRAGLANDADQTHHWQLIAQYSEDNGTNAAPRNLDLDVGTHEVSIGPDGVQDTDNAFYSTSLTLRSDLENWQLDSLSAISGYEQNYGFDFDGSQAPFSVPSLNANLAYDREFVQLSQETRLSRSWRDHELMFGLVAAYEDFSQDYLIWCGVLDPQTNLGSCPYVGTPGRVDPAYTGSATPMSLLTVIDQTRFTAAAFTYNDFALNDRLTLTLGGRLTHEDIEGSGSGVHFFDDGTVAFNNRGGIGPAIGGNTIIENQFSGNLALRYRLNSNQSVYASYSSGYKSGGFNGEVQNNATHFADEGLFGAETVHAYELGYKAQFTPALEASAAAYFQDYQDPQARIFVSFALPDGSSIVSNSLSNLDEASVYGFDLDVSWQVTPALFFSSALTLLETEIQQTSDVAGNAALFDGNPLPFASDVSLTALARYTHAINAQTNLIFETNAKYRSEYFLDAEGLEERSQDGFVTLDARATLNLMGAGYDVSIWGRNLLDEDYAVSGFGFIGYNTFRSHPRTIGISVSREL